LLHIESMSPRFALVSIYAACFATSAACSGDGDDDDCPDCRPAVGGAVTFPPTPPVTGGPEPAGGTLSTGGFGTGGLGGVLTGGFGGTTGGLGGTTGGVSPFGGDGGTGAFGAQGGDLTGGTIAGGFGGTL
jgi:hypothetical protein